MLRGDRVLLRTRLEADVPILHAGLYDDVATRLLVDSEPWRPRPVGDSPFRPREDSSSEAFTVVETASENPVGAATLWGIDNHNRLGHLGMSLLAEYRGRGYATEVVRLLCRYGFGLRGLHRLQIETLAGNAAMMRTAVSAGFLQEGRLRRSAWLDGRFEDEVIFGLLADEWQPE